MFRFAIVVCFATGCDSGTNVHPSDEDGSDDGPTDAAVTTPDAHKECQEDACMPRPCEPENWTAEILELAGKQVWAPAIAVDGDGTVHVTFNDREVDELRYARGPNDGPWMFSTIQKNAIHSSIAADPTGVYVAYAWDTDLWYANHGLSEDVFSKPSLVERYDVFSPLALALNGDGGATIAWDAGWEIRDAWLSPKSEWTVEEEVDVYYSDCKAWGTSNLSLVVDSVGGTHLVYMGCENDGLRYRHKPSPSADWSVATVDPEGGSFASLALDKRGIPHIVYGSGDGVLYAEGTADGSFDVVSLDSNRFGEMNFLWLDQWNGVHIIYGQLNDDATAASFRYAYRSPTGKWSTENTPIKGLISPYGAAVSSDGIIHAVYVMYEDTTFESSRRLGHLYGRCR